MLLKWSIFKQNSDNARPQFITGLGQRMQLFQMRDLRRILRNKDIDLASIGDHVCGFWNQNITDI